MRTSGRRGQKALDGALKRLGDPQGDLHKSAKRSLIALDGKYKALGASFDKRARARENADSRWKADATAKAEALLDETRNGVLRAKKLGNKGQIATAETQLQTAQRWIVSVGKAAKVKVSATRYQNRNDSKLRKWHDDLVAIAVTAMWRDNRAELVVAGLGAGAIVVGLVPVVGAPALAAAISSLLVAGDLRGKLNRAQQESKTDRDFARKAQAVVLIDAMKDLTDRWLTILK